VVCAGFVQQGPDFTTLHVHLCTNLWAGLHYFLFQFQQTIRRNDLLHHHALQLKQDSPHQVNDYLHQSTRLFLSAPHLLNISFTTTTSFPSTSRANPYLTPATSHRFLYETVSHDTTFALINLPLPLSTSPFNLNVVSSGYKTYKHTFKHSSPGQRCLFPLLVFACLVFDILFGISSKATYPPLSINPNLDINLVRLFAVHFQDSSSVSGPSKHTFIPIVPRRGSTHLPPLPSTSTLNPWFSASSFLSATTTHTLVSIILRPQTDWEHLALSNHHTPRSPPFFETASNN
jgi:hypothetical protein